MKAAVVVFPGSNCDRDMAVALRAAGFEVAMVWHKEARLPERIDLVAMPGGFSFGDYLRCGAIAAKSPICQSVIAHAQRGGFVLGVCNGFQVLAETGLLPGALIRNSNLKFLCKDVDLKVQSTASSFTSGYQQDQVISLPIAHHDGNYRLDAEGVKRLQDQDRIAFTYQSNPNGSVDDIAGVLSENKRILGLMPHPERAVEPAHGGIDGQAMFQGCLNQLASA